MALKTNALLALWAMLVLAAAMQASGHRAMLQSTPFMLNAFNPNH